MHAHGKRGCTYTGYISPTANFSGAPPRRVLLRPLFLCLQKSVGSEISVPEGRACRIAACNLQVVSFLFPFEFSLDRGIVVGHCHPISETVANKQLHVGILIIQSLNRPVKCRLRWINDPILERMNQLVCAILLLLATSCRGNFILGDFVPTAHKSHFGGVWLMIHVLIAPVPYQLAA